MPTELTRSLGVAGIVLMVVAAAAPITVVVANFPLILLESGTVGAPLMILGATLILLLFSVGYTWMTPARAGRRRLLRVRGPRPRGPSRAGHRRDRAAVLPPAHRLDDLLPGRPGGQPARAVDRARGAVVADLRPDDPGGGTAGPPHDRPVREGARHRAGARDPRRGGDRHRGARLR